MASLSISGKTLIKLSVKDGWEIRRQATHGLSLAKRFGDRTRVTVIPDSRVPLPDGTLAAIIGPRQMGIGRRGLETLIAKFG